ncbi:MAG: hypothetical protein COT85_05710 [Chlamydiae bacterium CG10_big_fil_rev_8_21_14_0_10_42_34]|nr:MAG: hypothetical protein COT85_05710 [Chlamydiae bacterium CG10_big_fil_rev_8_21_14_0_10_42_34]
MRSKLFFILLPLSLLAQMELEPQSMLYQAEWLSKKFNFEVAKAPPPLISPQPQSCLDTASVWFSIDLNEIAAPAFETLNNDTFWEYLREIGVQGVYLKGLKRGGAFRTGIGLDPRWGNDWEDLSNLLRKKGISLIGDSLGSSTGLSADFWLALKNVGDYPGLYHLVEIDKRDWKLLPKMGKSQFAVNVPWLTLQELHKKGYVPEEFTPYVKQSRWNTTTQVKCNDGKIRRWIYLKENEADPVIDWLNPSFAGCRIATADTLDSIFNLGEKIVKLDASINANTKQMMSLWTRKLGAFSVLESKGGLDEIKQASTDLVTDTITRPALLHALITEDAEALKLMYRLYLEEGIETKRLVHVLQPFDQFVCDWAELLFSPKKRFQYYDEILTGDALRTRLLKEDVSKIGPPETATWPKLCLMAKGIKDFQQKWEDSGETHLLLALFYAMQPGAFSFSVSDLYGTLQPQIVDLLKPNENTIYPSLTGQMNNPRSFAMQMRKLFSIRRDSEIESAELVDVPQTNQPGLIILVYQLKNSTTLQLLAVNFGKQNATQVLELPNIRQTTAIDLLTGLAEKKPLESSVIRLDVPPLSGKVIRFQTKYYD